MLIEEAAGLGEHRKRRRRAQLKLERTQDNLDRALDVEREARTRLKPLKRQAEAAELRGRIERQMDEARWTLARDDARWRARRWPRPRRPWGRPARPPRRPSRSWRRSASATRRPRRRCRRGRSSRESAVRRGSTRRSRPGSGSACGWMPRSARLRLGRAGGAPRGVDHRGWRRGGGRHRRRRHRGSRSTALQTELTELAEDHRVRLERELLELEAAARPPPGASRSARAARGGDGPQAAGEAAAESAREARRGLDVAAEKARRESARVGAELAKATSSCAPTRAPRVARTPSRTPYRPPPGCELALRAALGPRLRAAVAPDLSAGRAAVAGGQGRRRCADRPREAAPPAAAAAASPGTVSPTAAADARQARSLRPTLPVRPRPRRRWRCRAALVPGSTAFPVVDARRPPRRRSLRLFARARRGAARHARHAPTATKHSQRLAAAILRGRVGRGGRRRARSGLQRDRGHEGRRVWSPPRASSGR